MGRDESKSGSAPPIQFLFFEDCPLAGAAQAALERALEACDMDARDYELVDILDPATPSSLTGWGSPTILVNGEDVTGQARGDGVGCRIYATPDQVPDVETIAAAIRDSAAGKRPLAAD